MSDALEVEITEVIRGSNITYKICIVSQLFVNSSFGCGPQRRTDKFDASNGFRLRSVDLPEVRQKHVANKDSMRAFPRNILFVRGNGSYADKKIVEATSLSYILELKTAVKEYNDQFREGGDDTSG